MQIIRTTDVFRSVKMNLANLKKFYALVTALVEEGKIEDLYELEDEVAKEQSKCFAFIGAEIRIDCSMVHQWGRKENERRDTATVSLNATKYDGGIDQFLKDTGINLSAYGRVIR